MMDTRIKRIVIAGGGSAGWLSAAYLNRALGDGVEITLIESSAIDPVGVGEATIPSMGYTMRFLGFEDHEWMPEVQATYKAAIKFAGWSPSVKPSFFHPFSRRPEPMSSPFQNPYFLEIGTGFSQLHYAMQERLQGREDALVSMVLPTDALCEAQKSPMHPSEERFNLRTAYHLDAGLLAKFLRRVSTGRGVEAVVAHIDQVNLDQKGQISSLKMQDGREFTADLFIDCTGFRGLIINQAMGEPFLNDKEHLLCDSAVAIPCESDPGRDGINPYTISTAQKHGWTWDVPLMHRNGTGYVYSSDFTDAESAERELREFLGPRSENGAANHLKMRVGRTRSPWVKNCVAIGLSACFLEPLESTGIFLIEYGLANLVTLFPDKNLHASTARKYNKIMATMYQELRDFLVLHYCINKRDDTDFWRACREPSTIPDSLREKLEFFRHSLPVVDPSGFAMFNTLSYTAILDGNGELPKAPYPILAQTGFASGERALAETTALTREVLAAMPSHYEHLQRMYSGELTSAMATPARPQARA